MRASTAAADRAANQNHTRRRINGYIPGIDGVLMRIHLPELRNAAARVDNAEIRSLEGQFYMIQVLLDGQRLVVSDDRNKTMLLPSIPAANELLDEAGVRFRVLVHDSPYNEMVGLDDTGIDPLRIPTGRPR